ncbi:hypothetical protein CTAYLR_007722 [Chrysophaeum taylorii]|uniref:Sulfotransferase n=1 Tax=Chrysophaeum taylorii TaxID=2483200 RepID=A0AAD7UMZ5_9STRA|nr:hypothetical protein CTAYLR_007722 [Chrysophaeum taylorii]
MGPPGLAQNAAVVAKGMFGKAQVAPAASELHVIGAGLGRTGTSSLKLALESLGLKVYHMRENISNQHWPLWRAWSRSTSPEESARAIEGIARGLSSHGFNATTDFRPKVVLSVRSSGEVWATSVLSTIARFVPLMRYPPWSFFEGKVFDVGVINYGWELLGAPPVGGLPLQKDLAAAHDSWIDKVRATVPPDKLLIHEAKHGWKPLCEFLAPEFEQPCADILASGCRIRTPTTPC